MYKLTSKIVKFLSDHNRSSDIAGIQKDPVNPFVSRNLHSIGFVDPLGIIGSDCDYIVECDQPIHDLSYTPNIGGWWLYKRHELSPPPQPINVPKFTIDPHALNMQEELEITDCCVMVPPDVEKLTCTKITAVDRLLELEPKLKRCLNLSNKGRKK